MAEARLLIDSDVFVLLSGAGVLDRALALVGFDCRMALRLDALPHMIRRGRRFKHLSEPQVRELALNACNKVSAIIDRPGDEILQRLIAFPEIDDGEALLYALLAEQPAYLLASGDKRAMRTIGSASELDDVRQRIAGRVICLETILRMLVVGDGVSAVARAFAALADHKTMQVVFSDLNSTDERKCLASLDAYLRELKSMVGDDFLLEP